MKRRNWKTTLAGALLGAGLLVSGDAGPISQLIQSTVPPSVKQVIGLATAAAAIALGQSAKDATE